MAELAEMLDIGLDVRPSVSTVAIGLARAKLKPPIHKSSPWLLLAAAALMASTALGLAAVVILGPPTAVSRQIDVNPGMR